MGEAVISCEGDEALIEVEGSDACEGSTVRWERLLPRVALRVLLVEADDSTRQVIAALLRKCSYKVAAVSDGLKAWEMLKGRPNCIDLILTEVDLPSISGFALLTLIMEHGHCKNIPVIMMSSNDSVNMVYKCMLRGAADFLVKPVRKNELQNLWQHVWRRQSSAGGGQQQVPDESITQRKIEGLSDSDLPINLSNGACTPQNEECAEKGNDAQSSCSVPDLEAESACTENMQRNSNSKLNKLVTLNAEFDEEECVRGDSAALKPARVVKGSSLEATEDAVMIIQQEDPGGKRIGGDDNTTAEASDNNDAFINGSGEARDLIGTFQNHSTKSYVNLSVITGVTKYDSCPQLDLSLRRSDDFQSHQNTTVDERRHTVHQSNVSAFSRYRSIQIQPKHQAQASAYHRSTEYEASSDKHLLSSPVQPSKPDTQKSYVYQASSELRQGEHLFSCPQPRMLPVTVPVKGVRLDRTCTSYGSSLHSSFYNQTGASPTKSPDSAGQKEVFSRLMQVADPNSSSCSNQTMLRQEMNLDTMEHMRNVLSGNERSQNSSLCNGDITRLNSYGGGSACGSNGSGNPTAERKAEGISAPDESGNRSLQREAALTKFRQKRKDRCFEKKVRYESRKKLAEQRPRVKGQFVRQVPTDISTSTTVET